MLTIKILFTINSLKKTIPSKHYLQFLSFKKKPLSFDWKKSFNQKQIIRIKNISFQLNQSIPIFLKKLFSRSIAFSDYSSRNF